MKINLDEIEKKAFTTYQEDGLFEIFIGFLMCVRTVGSIISNDDFRAYLTIPLMVVIAPLGYILAKKFITLPRLGYVKFGRARMRKLGHMMLSIFAVLLIVAVIGMLSNNSSQQTIQRPNYFFAAVIPKLISRMKIKSDYHYS